MTRGTRCEFTQLEGCREVAAGDVHVILQEGEIRWLQLFLSHVKWKQPL